MRRITKFLAVFLTLALLSISCMVTSQVPAAKKGNLENVKQVDIQSLGTDSYKTIGQGRIYDTEYSPDNQILAVGTSVGVILYETKSYKVIESIPANFVERLAW